MSAINQWRRRYAIYDAINQTLIVKDHDHPGHITIKNVNPERRHRIAAFYHCSIVVVPRFKWARKVKERLW